MLRISHRTVIVSTVIGFFLLLDGCASLPQKVSMHADRGEFIEAKTLLEKEGAWQQVQPGAKPEAVEARRIFAQRVENKFTGEAVGLAHTGLLHSALAKVNDGLSLCPWSENLSDSKTGIAKRLKIVDGVVSKWKDTPSGPMPLADARAFLEDLHRIKPDYSDTASLIKIRDVAISSIIAEWENRIRLLQKPVTKENSEQFWNDLELAGLSELKSNPCFLAMPSLSIICGLPEKISIVGANDLFLQGAICISEEAKTDLDSSTYRMVSASQQWLQRWYEKSLPVIADHEDISFETIDAYETVLNRLPIKTSAVLRHQVGLMHLKAADERAGSGASAVLSLLHIARAQQLNNDIPTSRIEKVKKIAAASLIAGEKLGSWMAIDCDPSINPQIYDFVRTAIMVAIRARTKGHFSWHFLAPGQKGVPEELTIDAIDLEIPIYDELKLVTSEYYSHNESVVNPFKTFLSGMLNSAKMQLDWSENSYHSAVSSHNIYPTQYSLMNVNNAYNNYIAKLNEYNRLVSQYNSTPSTIDRPVFMSYSFREGLVKYGWEVRIRYNISGRTGVASGESMESDFVRIGTRYNDRNASRRRDDDLGFDISLDRTIEHLFKAVNTALNQIGPAIAEAVPLKYTTGFTDKEIRTAKWFLHPWGSDIETGKKNGVPQWALDSAQIVQLPEVSYTPAELIIPMMKQGPKLPMDAAGAAQWYKGLVGVILAEKRGFGQALSTGSVISPDGLILTCAHGLGGEKLKIVFGAGPCNGSYDAEIVFVNENSDVALIRAKGLKTDRWIEIRSNAESKKGEEIVAIGNPVLPDGTPSIEAISKGIVSNPESEFYGIPRLVADISVASGSSGGPLISLSDGKIVGVVVAVAGAEIGRGPEQRSASGKVCLAAPAKRLPEWLGIHSHMSGDVRNQLGFCIGPASLAAKPRSWNIE